jgi:Peptidase M50B-like
MTPAPSMSTVLSRIGETQGPLPAATAVLIGLAAVAAVGVQEIWLLARHLNTIAHEGAHAIVGSAVGRPVRAVRLWPNADGSTVVGPGKPSGDLTIGLAGYLGPSAFGLGLAKLIELRHTVMVLWLTMLLLALLLATLREPFSFVPVLVVGGLLFVIARYGSLGVQSVTAYGVTWFLLLSGIRVVIDHGISASDAGALARLTHIRPGFWVVLWLAGTVFALVFGGTLLV